MAKLSAVARFLLEYVEVLLAAILALVVSYLGAVRTLKGDDLTEANIALLGVLAIAILRERWERRSLASRVEQAMSVAVKPWNTLNEELCWDIEQADGSLAQATARKQLQFMQDEVFSVYEYSYAVPAAGRVLRHDCEGGAPGETPDRLPIIHEDFPGPDNRTYRLISLERVWNRGEVMEFRSIRVLENHFLQATENVAKEVPVPTHRISMELRWPLSRKPTAVWIERTNKARAPVPVAQLKRSGARHVFKHVITDPQVGERIIVKWTW